MKRESLLWFIVCIVMCSPIGGCKKASPSPTVLESNPGIIETRLHLWEADEGIRGFIKEKGWTHSQELLNSWTFKLIAATPTGDKVVFECSQERTKAAPVTIYITKNGDSAQPQLTDELRASLEYRFNRTFGLKAKAKKLL
ncbi:MAG TPA: hypothetical protein PKH24_21085 [Sedimentisphaerales bacterium]|nr:hypothetical protein [Sedimentisphaerales bacterium]HNU31745.1 hypothetical protein [Sedimentisphaerales bacterium]